MSETDQQKADRILQILTRTRYIHPDAAVEQVAALRDEIGHGGNVERERAEAWLAICGLHDALLAKSRREDLDSRFSRAIEKTEAWQASIK
jgi:hypothetical protein